MKKFIHPSFVLPFGLLILMLAGCFQRKDGTYEDLNGTWTLNGNKYSVQSCTWDSASHILESDCDNDNKVWLLLGARPTVDGSTLKIVNYGKQPLAANEMTIDVAHGVGLDYLSTGYDNKTAVANVVASSGRLIITFKGVTVRGANSSGSTNDSTSLDAALEESNR